MTTQHTPGPWAFDMDSDTEAVIFNKSRRIVCEIKRKNFTGNMAHSFRAVQDARLIAAAPELLEALKGFLAEITEYQTNNNLGGENNHWQVIARAAIAKATEVSA